MIPKARQQKRLKSFIDKLAEKNRLRRARHKGGFVPAKRRAVEVEFYASDEENDKKEGDELGPLGDVEDGKDRDNSERRTADGK